MQEEQETKPPRDNWDRPIAGPQQPGAWHAVAVYGRSSELAYARRSTARPVTFLCSICKHEHTEYRYPGKKPRYCSDTCRAIAAEERNEERVRKQREKRHEEREARIQAQKQTTHT